jgi:hypothetical protein
MRREEGGHDGVWHAKLVFELRELVNRCSDDVIVENV